MGLWSSLFGGNEPEEIVIGTPEFDELFDEQGNLKRETFGDDSFMIVTPELASPPEEEKKPWWHF